MFKNYRRRNRDAFTLLELIVVITILGILAVIAIPTFAKAISKSKDASALAAMEAIDRDAHAMAALDDRPVTLADYQAAAAETGTTAAGPGLLATGTWSAVADGPGAPNVVGVSFNGRNVGLVTQTASNTYVGMETSAASQGGPATTATISCVYATGMAAGTPTDCPDPSAGDSPGAPAALAATIRGLNIGGAVAMAPDGDAFYATVDGGGFAYNSVATSSVDYVPGFSSTSHLANITAIATDGATLYIATNDGAGFGSLYSDDLSSGVTTKLGSGMRISSTGASAMAVSGGDLYIDAMGLYKIDLTADVQAQLQAASSTPLAGCAVGDGLALSGTTAYLANPTGNTVESVDASGPGPVVCGTLTTVAGNGTAADSGDGGPATAASLNGPYAVAVSGNVLYVGETGGVRIRAVDLGTGIISTVAGTGTAGAVTDGPGSASQIGQVLAMAGSTSGVVFSSNIANGGGELYPNNQAPSCTWTKRPGQWVNLTTVPAYSSSDFYGWKEGYFTGTGSSLTWHAGSWVVNTTTTSDFWKGATAQPAGATGMWVAGGAGGRVPQPGQVWKSDTWAVNADGSLSWSAGSWQTAPAGQTYLGESWYKSCA